MSTELERRIGDAGERLDLRVDRLQIHGAGGVGLFEVLALGRQQNRRPVGAECRPHPERAAEYGQIPRHGIRSPWTKSITTSAAKPSFITDGRAAPAPPR